MTSLAYRTPTERAVDGDLAILETCVSALRARAWTPEQLSRLGRVVARLDAMVAERYGDQGCRCAVIEVDGGELHDLGCGR